MINYVFVNFLPGAAGNFFSRALGLVDNAYCWVPASSSTIELTLDEKLDYFSYKNIKQDRNWVDFEDQLVHYSSLVPQTNLPDNAISIWADHYSYDLRNKQIAGADDTQLLMQITYNEPMMFEWLILNALYKNSYLDVSWFKQYQIYNRDASVAKIDLKNFLDKDKFLNMYSNTIQLLNINPGSVNLDAVEELHGQWIKTTLSFDNFEEFKSSIGWII